MIALFFPHTGLLNPLDSPHHMRIDDESEYREGIVLDRPSKQGKGSLVNCGMRKVRMYEGRRWTHKKADGKWDVNSEIKQQSLAQIFLSY